MMVKDGYSKFLWTLVFLYIKTLKNVIELPNFT